MKTIILCGGRGTRLKEETEHKPKPMVEIGGLPILVHIMKLYAYHGHKEFYLCLGYKGSYIKDYFLHYSEITRDFTLDLSNHNILYHTNHDLDFKITFVETGLDTQTGERVKIVVKKYINDEEFMITYGDGVSTVPIPEVIKYHQQQVKKHAIWTTITAVHPSSKYGKVYSDENDLITRFDEKPVLNDYINGGFMVMNRKSIRYAKDGNTLEEVLQKLSKHNRLTQFRYDGFWHSMDTYKDYEDLNKMWSASRPWAIWEKNNESKT